MEKQVITKLFNQGIKLHRLVKDRKQPLHEGSFKGESLKDLITHNGNIGVICGELSGIIVLDLDIHNDNEPSGFDSLKQMEQDNEKLPQTYTVDTPTGGRHLYFKLPHSWNGTRFYPKLDKYPQIDFRNNGQYVVAESSTLDYINEKNTTPVSGEYINNIGNRPLVLKAAGLSSLVVSAKSGTSHFCVTASASGSCWMCRCADGDWGFHFWSQALQREVSVLLSPHLNPLPIWGPGIKGE